MSPFSLNLGKNEFSHKKGIFQFLDIPFIYHRAKNQKKQPFLRKTLNWQDTQQWFYRTSCRTGVQKIIILDRRESLGMTVFKNFRFCYFVLITQSSVEIQNPILSFSLSRHTLRSETILAIESPFKMMKMFFISPQSLFLFSRYLNLCLDFLVM